jgi:hypothetical protein
MAVDLEPYRVHDFVAFRGRFSKDCDGRIISLTIDLVACLSGFARILQILLLQPTPTCAESAKASHAQRDFR